MSWHIIDPATSVEEWWEFEGTFVCVAHNLFSLILKLVGVVAVVTAVRQWELLAVIYWSQPLVLCSTLSALIANHSKLLQICSIKNVFSFSFSVKEYFSSSRDVECSFVSTYPLADCLNLGAYILFWLGFLFCGLVRVMWKSPQGSPYPERKAGYLSEKRSKQCCDAGCRKETLS